MRGRKPDPTALKLLKGNPGKRALPKNEPKPPKTKRCPSAPSHLHRLARNEWRRIVPELHRLGLLTVLDIRSIEAYCSAYSQMRIADKVLQESGQTYECTTEAGGTMVRKRPEVEVYFSALAAMRAYASEFGLTPSGRVRVKGVGAEPAEKKKNGKESDDDFMRRRRVQQGALSSAS